MVLRKSGRTLLKHELSIPSKVNTKDLWECDYWLYKERHLVECFFKKIKRRTVMNLKKIACFVSGFMFLFGGNVPFSENVHAKDSMNVLSYPLSLEETRIIQQSLSGSVRFTLQELNMKKNDVLHLNVYGDVGDVIQVYFYYTDNSGNMSSSIIGGLGGTVLDSNMEISCRMKQIYSMPDCLILLFSRLYKVRC